jgi:WG containing repeat
MSINNLGIGISLGSILCLLASCNLNSLSSSAATIYTPDASLSSPRLVRDPDPYQEMDDSEILTIEKQPIVIINVRGKDVYFDRRRGKILKLPSKVESISNFSEGLARASKNGKKYGFINERGEWTIPPRFDLGNDYFPRRFRSIEDFQGGMAVVLVGKKYGLINKQGKFIISPQSDRKIYPYIGRNGILVELNGSQKKCIDNRGVSLSADICKQIQTEAQAKEIKRTEPAFRVDNGAVYLKGKLLADRRWDAVFGQSYYDSVGYRGVYIYQVGNKWGLVHESGAIRTLPQFDNIGGTDSMSKKPPNVFYNGLAKVSIDGKFGFIDEMGRLVIPPKFEEVSHPFDFDPERAIAKLNGKWIHIDRQGNFLFPVYGDLDFNHNVFDRRFGSLAMVKIKDKYGFIDRQGKLVVPPKYDEIVDDTPNNGYGIESYYDSVRKEKITQARIGNKWGYINTQGAIQIPLKFDNAGSFKYGVAEVTVGKRIFYIDRQGKILPF